MGSSEWENKTEAEVEAIEIIFNLFQRKETFHRERWESRNDGYQCLWVAVEEVHYGCQALGHFSTFGFCGLYSLSLRTKTKGD